MQLRQQDMVINKPLMRRYDYFCDLGYARYFERQQIHSLSNGHKAAKIPIAEAHTMEMGPDETECVLAERGEETDILCGMPLLSITSLSK